MEEWIERVLSFESRTKGSIPAKGPCNEGPSWAFDLAKCGEQHDEHGITVDSHSPFFDEIESLDMPWRFVEPIFINYDGKSDLVEHATYYNQSMAINSKNEALMCKIFPSSLGTMTMRWFDSLEKGSICSYNKLTWAFGARFMTCSWVPKPYDSPITMSLKEGETLRV